MSNDFSAPVTQVVWANMDAGEQEFHALCQELFGILESLETQLNQKSAAWVGDAQAAYGVAKATWNQEASKLAEIVGVMSKSIGFTHENMRQVERLNASMFGN